VLTSYLDWSWIFFINIPVGLIVIGLTPWLVRESRAALSHRHFDFTGAASITGGLMLLVYAMTRATQEGWGSASTIGLLAGAAALVAAFVAIELRSRAPLLPLRIFRLRTLAAANATAVVIASVAFSQFFLLTLYMQDVLRYSAIQTGLGFVAITLTITVFSNVAQNLVTRFGPRRVLTAGLLLAAASLAMAARLPVEGHYLWDIFPMLLVGGVGLALCFVPVTIAGLTGVQPAEAGVASGLINTSRQIGGAVGLAAVSTIAATYSARYADGHAGSTPLDGAALTHGFQIAFSVLTVLAVIGAGIAATFVRAQPRVAADEPARAEALAARDAA
jgi:MFS family permease